MGLSELMRIITIFVTFCLNKKKIPQGLRGKIYTNQFSLQSKGFSLLQWRITGKKKKERKKRKWRFRAVMQFDSGNLIGGKWQKENLNLV